MWSYNYTYPNYLAHYGVVGMKWGIRKARKLSAKGAKYSIKAKYATNSSTKAKYSAKAKAANAKSQRITSTLKNSAGSTAAYNYTKNQSLGKAIVKASLMGSYGAAKYNKARSEGQTRGLSIVEGLLYNAGNGLSGGLLNAVNSVSAVKKTHTKK